MSDSATPGADGETDATEAGGPDPLDDVREAAGAVVSSLKALVEAAERVVEDPEAFSQFAASGRSVVEAFLGGFASPGETPPEDSDGDGDDTAFSD